MAFKQRCKQHLAVGKKVSIHVNGLEYSGEVIEVENMNPQDAHVMIKNEDGTAIIPITYSMVVVLPNQKEDELEEDEEELEEPIVKKKTKKQK